MPTYKDRPDKFIDPVINNNEIISIKPFNWTEEEKSKLDDALHKIAIGLDAEMLLAFYTKSGNWA